MYNCELCGKSIKEADFDQLDEQAGDSDKIICNACIAKFNNEKRTSVKVLAKVGKAALVLITWKDEVEEVSDNVSETAEEVG